MIDKKYYIPDMETGYKIEVSKEAWKEFQKAYLMWAPRVNSIKGQVQIFGTSGNMEPGDLASMFYEPENFQIVR